MGRMGFGRQDPISKFSQIAKCFWAGDQEGRGRLATKDHKGLKGEGRGIG